MQLSKQKSFVSLRDTSHRSQSRGELDPLADDSGFGSIEPLGAVDRDVISEGRDAIVEGSGSLKCMEVGFANETSEVCPHHPLSHCHSLLVGVELKMEGKWCFCHWVLSYKR